jgi:hypothetical protein
MLERKKSPNTIFNGRNLASLAVLIGSVGIIASSLGKKDAPVKIMHPDFIEPFSKPHYTDENTPPYNTFLGIEITKDGKLISPNGVMSTDLKTGEVTILKHIPPKLDDGRLPGDSRVPADQDPGVPDKIHPTATPQPQPEIVPAVHQSVIT